LENKINILLKNELPELQKVSENLESFFRKCNVPENSAYTAHLTVEEMVSNVIKYAYRDSGEHEISITASLVEGRLSISIEDDGIEFNPLSTPQKNTDIPLHERAVGGLGIHIVKNMVDSISYCRRVGKNRLQITLACSA
jgi:anti-sigma regulatory factor (Ser/Thr protein kinase)